MLLPLSGDRTPIPLLQSPHSDSDARFLIVLKSFADRPKDWVDIEGIIIRQAEHLDWPYVREQLAPLAELKESPEILRRLNQLRERLES